MSQLDIKRTVQNFTKGKTNIYSPLVEAIVNSIDAIDESHRTDGSIEIIVKRSTQAPLNLESSALPPIVSFEIIDNGIGFNKDNRDSFDTLFSSLKEVKGAKGYGRFTYLKYFEKVRVESIYQDGSKFFERSFDFGSDKEIVVNEQVEEVISGQLKTTLYLEDIKDDALDKEIDTLARKLLEKLLIYFINDKYTCPKISIREEGKMDSTVLNEFLNKENGEIQLVHTEESELKNSTSSKKFQFKIFKIFYPYNQKSRISLTAHNREVVDIALSRYVPEFADDFYQEFENQDKTKSSRNYIIKTYVLGEYLDVNVSVERGGFLFSEQSSLYYDFSREDIEHKAAEITKKIFLDEVKTRSEKKLKKIEEYITNEAPWNKEYLGDIDITSIPYNLDNEAIELELHKVKFKQEREARAQVKQILDNPDSEVEASVAELISKISKAEISELVHYIALRRTILSLFKKSLEIKDNGKYSLESAVHDIIFPTRTDTETTPYKKHNLWIVDEKLNFTEYVSSDKPLNGGTSERVDMLVFNRKMVFRGDNESSNPVTVFEFKRPQRDDFADPSSKEDPVEQIIRYVIDIKEGKYKTPEGRNIAVADNTPFYGFVVCDLTQKVKDWLYKNKDFKQMPDGKGWFKWFDNNNLYIEVLSWDKVLSDAEMRNKIFFNKLGID